MGSGDRQGQGTFKHLLSVSQALRCLHMTPWAFGQAIGLLVGDCHALPSQGQTVTWSLPLTTMVPEQIASCLTKVL